MSFDNRLLNDITNNLDGKRIPLNESQRREKQQNELYPYIGANNILCYIDDYIFNEEILCIAEDGGSWGRNENCSFIINEKCWVNNHAHVLTSRNGVDLSYLKYYLNHTDLTKYITGTTRGKLTKTALGRIQIPLPPLETQQKIAAILNKADELRCNDQKILEKYDQLAQSVFLEMFGDPAFNQNRWPQLTLPEFAKKGKHSIKRGPFGGALKKEIFVIKGFLVYEQYHAINDEFSMSRYFIDEAKYKELKGFKVVPGDLIISCSGVTLGRIAEIPKDAMPGIINQALLKISLDQNKMNNTYFKFLFRHKRIQDILFGISRGSGIPNFPPMNTIKSIFFPTPPIKLQSKFAFIIEQIETQKQLTQQSHQKSEELFQSLLQRAFKGELVKHDEYNLKKERVSRAAEEDMPYNTK